MDSLLVAPNQISVIESSLNDNTQALNCGRVGLKRVIIPELTGKLRIWNFY